VAINPKVSAFVRGQIAKNYDTPTVELRRAAAKIDPSVRRRSGRSFFATYVLPARRAVNARAVAARTTAGRPAVEDGTTPAGELLLTPLPDDTRVTAAPVHVPSSGFVAEDLLRRILTDVAAQAMRVESRTDFVDLLARIDRHARDTAASLTRP
jgi:hypothetical protein